MAALSPEHRKAVSEALSYEVNSYVDDRGVTWRHCMHCGIFTDQQPRKCIECQKEGDPRRPRRGRNQPTELLMQRARGLGGYGLALEGA